MIDAAWLVLVGVVGASLVRVLRTRYDAAEFQVIQASFVAHLVSTLAHIYIATVVYGAADMFMYHEFASELAAATREDPRLLEAVGQLIVQIDPNLTTVFVPVAGGTVGSMVAFTSLACLLTNDSFWGAGAVFAVTSVASKLFLYEGMRIAIPERSRQLCWAVFLVPSAVFWTGGIIKEAVAMGGLSLYFLGAVQVVEKRQWTGLAWMALGAVPMYGVKPYILAAAGLATIAWAYGKRAQAAGEVLKPGSILAGAVGGYGFLWAVGKVVPRIALDHLLDEVSRMQEAGYSGRGSAYTLSASVSHSAAGQLVLMPLALFTGLYRPGLWEVRNGLMAANALETAVFLGGSFNAARRLSLQRLLEAIRAWPLLLFLLAFVLIMGLATGLTSANLGTLSRYRMPLLPFFAALLFLLNTPPPAQLRR